MSTYSGEQATLDAYAGASPDADPEPSTNNDAHTAASSGRDEDASRLAAIFEDITGDTVFVEPQRETPSHAVLDGESEAPDLSEDGLADAADSDLQIGGWI